MATAPVLDLEETRPVWVRDQTQRELHEGFDLWLDTLEETVKEEPASLDALARRAHPALGVAAWETLCDAPGNLRPRRIVVQTRFRPDRDVALMTQYCDGTAPSDNGPPVVVSFSLGTDRNDLIRAWERATPSYERRMKSIETLRISGIFVVATLSPFGLWKDLEATLRQLQPWGVAYITVLFFKENTRYANIPPLFLQYLREHYPMLLDPVWQEERVREIVEVYGKSRVLVGQHGFESLALPHEIT